VEVNDTGTNQELEEIRALTTHLVNLGTINRVTADLVNFINPLKKQVRNTKKDLLNYITATFTEVTLEDDEDKENKNARQP
jgi:hypothetical protein